MAGVPLAALLGIAGCGEVGPTVGPATSAEMEAARELAVRVNRHRASIGCTSLVWYENVATVAQRHSEDMVARRFFAHTNPDGESLFDRLKAADIAYRSAGENLAAGQATTGQVLGAWLASPGHRANVEDCTFTHQGVGLHERHWTHLVLTPR